MAGNWWGADKIEGPASAGNWWDADAVVKDDAPSAATAGPDAKGDGFFSMERAKGVLSSLANAVPFVGADDGKPNPFAEYVKGAAERARGNLPVLEDGTLKPAEPKKFKSVLETQAWPDTVPSDDELRRLSRRDYAKAQEDEARRIRTGGHEMRATKPAPVLSAAEAGAKRFAEDNPVTASINSSAAQSLAGLANAPSAAAQAGNEMVRNAMIGFGADVPASRVPNMPLVDDLMKMSGAYTSELQRRAPGEAWDRGEFGQWLLTQLGGNSMNTIQSLGALMVPGMQGALLTSMGATAAGTSYATGDSGIASIGKGVVEAVSEKLPLEAAGFATKKVSSLIEKIPAASRNAILQDAGRRLVAAGGAVTFNSLVGAIEESAAQIGGNAIDIAIDGKTKSLFDEVDRAAIVGAAANTSMAAPAIIEAARRPTTDAGRLAGELADALNGGQFAQAGIDQTVSDMLRTVGTSDNIAPTSTSMAAAAGERARLEQMRAPRPTVADIGKAASVDEAIATAAQAVAPDVPPSVQPAQAAQVPAGTGRAVQLDEADLLKRAMAGIGIPQDAAPLAPAQAAPVVAPEAATPAAQDQPVRTWFGRRGDGYATPEDAQRGLRERQRLQKDLQWRIEQTPEGRYRLAGYAVPVGGTQALQTPSPKAEPAMPKPLPAARSASQGQDIILQNRDRNTPASIDQMQSIAANPDYLRAGPSRTLDQGAPVAFGAMPPSAVQGRAETVADGRGQRIQIQYAVVEAADLLTSNQADGTPLPEYATGEAGRLRVVAGNGRTAGLQAAYLRGTAAQYREELQQDAQSLGIDPQAVAAMREPVLIRVMNEADVTPDIADRSNIQAGAEMSAVERANNDARRIHVSDMEFHDNGTPTEASLLRFIQSMPVSERGGLVDDKGPTQQAIDRVMAVAFKQAYGGDELVRLFAQATDPESRVVIGALARIAGRMAQLDGAGAFDIRGAVADAAGMAITAKRRGKKLADIVLQGDLDLSPEAVVVARFMADNIRSGQRIADGLLAWVDLALDQVRIVEQNASSTGMFGEEPTLSRQQLFERLGKNGDTATAIEEPAAQRGGAVAAGEGAERREAEPAGDGRGAEDGAGGRGAEGTGQDESGIAQDLLGDKPNTSQQLSADEQAAQDREEARAKEPSLPPALSARLQEAHKAHGRDVKRSVVERSIANEKANNTGTPKAKRERADRIARLEADLALFDEAAAMPPKEAAGLTENKVGRKDSAQIAQPESVVGEVQRSAAPSAITPTTTQGTTDAPQAAQAQQASPQPAQAAATQGLTNAPTPQNIGAQAAPAAGQKTQEIDNAQSSTAKALIRLAGMKGSRLIADDGRGRKLFEVKVTPEFRNRHFVNGRMPMVDGLELKEKSSVTGNAYDDGYILIDNREQLAARRAATAGAQSSTAAGASGAITPAEWQTDSASERFSVGRSLTKAQRRQVLASLVDAYKAKGAQREFKGLDGNGNERYGYIYSPELFEKSDITGAMVRYYVTLPDGRIAHPTELFPDVSASDIERMALEQDAKRRHLEAFENAIKPFYQDFDSANLMAVTGQVVISKGDRFAIIPNRIGAVYHAREQGWELAKPAPADVRRALQADMEGAVADGFVEQGDAPMFSRTKAITPAQRAENFARWSDNAPLISSEQAEAYDFKTGQKIVVEAFHGSARPDRIGGVFDPKRATSGPMAYFTSSPELASSYAKGKADTSLADEDQSYANWFKFKPPGARSAVSIDRAWNSLTPEAQARIRKLAPQIAMDDTGENIVIDPDNTDGLGNYGWELRQARGNPLAALVESWLNSGTLFNEETKFMDVLRMAGFPVAGVEMDFPNAAYPGVFKTYVSMKNPLVVGDMPADVRAALEQAAKADRTKAKPGADMWDKRSHTLRDWWAKFTDPDPSTATYAWTSIPDKVTDILKAHGYDGIVDWSGKGGGHQSPVYVPFGPTQVKSVFNRGTFDPTKKDISFGRGANAAIGTPAATIRAAITKAYGKLLGQLESKGLVTLTQTQEQAIEAAAQARAAKTGQPLAEVRASLMGSVSNSVATDTPAFKRWFGDSKVVDAEGKPLVVYHGNTDDIAIFKDDAGVKNDSGWLGRGFYFTTNPDTANTYANIKAGAGSPNVMPVFLSIKNPYVATLRDKEEGALRGFGGKTDFAKQKRAELMAQGYDGVVLDYSNGGWANEKEVVAFHPEQIKSAIGNNGNFDPNDLDIRRSANGAIQGFFDPQTGQSFLIADNLTAEAAPGVLMHEVGIHMAADGSSDKGKAAFDKITARAGELLKLGRGNPFFDRVNQRMLDAQETSNEEAAAYIAEEYERDRVNAPASVKRWVTDFMAAVRAWLFGKGVLIKASDLGAADIAAIARANVRKAARGDGVKGGAGAVRRSDGESRDIRFSYATAAAQGNTYTLPDERFGGLRRKMQDYFIRALEVQNAVASQGGTVNEQTDFYRAEELSSGRRAALVQDFGNNVVQPLMERAAQLGIDLSELSLYAYAKHAQERNEYIATINDRLPDGGSGMTTADANAIMDKVRQEGREQDFEELHQGLMDITASTRALQLSEGLITQDEFDAMQAQYQNYIPLRGFEQVDENDQPTGRSPGKGFNIRGRENLRALGRSSRAGELIENAIHDYIRTVDRGERNQVGKVFLNFVLQNPDAGLWEVDATRTRAAMDHQTGKVKGVTSIDKGEDTIAVKVAGREVYVRIHDPLLLRAMRKSHTDDRGDNERLVVRALGLYTALLRNTLTRYNPEFALTNALRDYGFGMAAMVDELGEKGAAKFTRHYAGAVAAAHRNERNKADPQNREWDKYFTEFRLAGGMTAGFYVKNTEEIGKDIRTMMLKAGAEPKNKTEALLASSPARAVAAAGRVLEYAGSVSENAARVAAYRTAREMGKSPSEAASIAKNLTTNFDRKGELGQVINAAYVFYNAAVQGSHRLLKMLANPKVAVYMAGFGVAGLALALANADWGGDDPDDGMAYWDKIPAYEKERNLIIMLPPGAQMAGEERVGTQGRYIKIPLQYGLNLPVAYGYAIADVIRNQRDKSRGMSPVKAGVTMASYLAGAFNPFSGSVDLSNGSSMAQAALPSLGDAVVQFATGTNGFGRDVAPFKSPFDTKPDSENYNLRQADSVSLKIAQLLNRATGGSAAEAGGIDISAGTVENLIRNVSGGTGAFLYDVGNLAWKSVDRATGGDPDIFVREMPLARRMYGELGGDVDQGIFYDSRKKTQEAAGIVKRSAELDMEPSEENQTLASMDKFANKATRDLAKLRREMIRVKQDGSLSNAEKTKELRELRAARDQITAGFNQAFTEVMRVFFAEQKSDDKINR